MRCVAKFAVSDISRSVLIYILPFVVNENVRIETMDC